MDKISSIDLSAKIGKIIAERFPKIEYNSEEIQAEKLKFTEADFKEMEEIGLYRGDFELFYVIREFCSMLNLNRAADGEYISCLFENAEKFGADDLYCDEYISGIEIPDVHEGDIFLTKSNYERGEIFQYDMPDFSKNIVVPKLGFYTDRVYFPTIYEKNMPWVSVCPSEINSMQEQISMAHGNVLVLGLGLGYYPYRISFSKEVKHIDIIEINPKIIRIFEKYILPQFKHKDKISVVNADAVKFIASVKDGDYDFCFADIWEGAVDGAPLYKKIKANEKRLKSTLFTYWIEDQIKAYLFEKR